MKDIVRKLTLFTILISGMQVIQLPYIGLSLFQIFLIITILAGFAGIVANGKIYNGKYIAFALLFGASSIIAWLMSTNPGWARSYLLLGFMTAAMVFVVCNYFDYQDLNVLEKALIRSQYIAILFSLYSFYMFYFRGGLPNHISLFAGMSITLDDNSLIRGQAASQVRLMLPYATPPVLSVAMAMCIILLLTNKALYEKKARRLLIVVYGIILILTASRTGMLGLALALGILELRKLCKRGTLKISQLIAIVSSIAVLIVFFQLGRYVTYLSKMFERFTISNLMQDRHFLVPLDGILIWLGSFKNFMLGIGFGSSLNMMGKHTYLPPYFLNSFITLVAERGFMGLCIVILLIWLTMTLFRKARIARSIQIESLTATLLTGFLCCVFYEALNCYLLIFVLAISFMADRCAVTGAWPTNLGENRI